MFFNLKISKEIACYTRIACAPSNGIKRKFPVQRGNFRSLIDFSKTSEINDLFDFSVNAHIVDATVFYNCVFHCSLKRKAVLFQHLSRGNIRLANLARDSDNIQLFKCKLAQEFHCLRHDSL